MHLEYRFMKHGSLYMLVWRLHIFSPSSCRYSVQRLNIIYFSQQEHKCPHHMRNTSNWCMKCTGAPAYISRNNNNIETTKILLFNGLHNQTINTLHWVVVILIIGLKGEKQEDFRIFTRCITLSIIYFSISLKYFYDNYCYYYSIILILFHL